MDNGNNNDQFFSVDARTIFQLGKEAIENELLAVSELVKNAYDADSPDCIVDFLTKVIKNEKNEVIEIAESIIIKDTGIGMSRDNIINNWLRIGTTNKKNEPFTPNKRRKIGEKGIGRLALNRLGDYVELYSHKKNSLPVLLTIDFKSFRSGDLIHIPVTLIESPENFEDNFYGTKIVISELTEVWDVKKIIELERKTITLQNPFSQIDLNENNDIVKKQDEKKNIDFHVYVKKNSKPFESDNSQLKNIPNHSLFRARIVIDTVKNEWSYRYSFHPYDKMSKVKYSLKSSNGYVPIEFKEERKIIKLKPDNIRFGKFEITLFAYDFSSLVNRLSPITTIRPMIRIVREFGGVKVFRDNQRVYNYGEVGNDWLELDVKRLNRPGATLSNNVMLGSVTLNRNESENLREKTNREGFIDNELYKRFKTIVQAAIFDFSKEVELYKSRIKTFYEDAKKKNKSDEIYEDLITTIDLAAIDESIKTNIKSYVILYKEQMDYLKEVLFNVSINTMDYINIFHDLEEKLHQLKINISKVTKDSIILNQLDETTLFVKTHNDLIRDREKKTYIVNTLLHSYLFEQKYNLQRNEIEVQTDFSQTKDMTFILHQPSIKRVLNNIISNSIYWTSANERKMISIKTDIENGLLTITVDDNGPGFDGDIEYLKEPFVSRKRGNMGLGLGLFIIEELMHKQNGYAEYSNDSAIENGGARVKLYFQIEKKED